MSSEESETI